MTLIFRDLDLNFRKDYLLGRYLEWKRKDSCRSPNKNKQNRIFWLSFRNKSLFFVFILLGFAHYLYNILYELWILVYFIPFNFIKFWNCFLCRPFNSFKKSEHLILSRNLNRCAKTRCYHFWLTFKKLSKCKSLPKPNDK